MAERKLLQVQRKKDISVSSLTVLFWKCSFE